MHRDLLGEFGRRNEERERMVVGLGQESNSTGATERADPLQDVRRRDTSLLDERAGDRDAEAELGAFLEKSREPVERRSVAPFGNPAEDREIPVLVEVRAARTEVQVAEPGQSPRLVQVEIQNDLQIRIPSVRIASR
jgi:hypothetical protein